jgi:hypothetical protein
VDTQSKGKEMTVGYGIREGKIRVFIKTKKRIWATPCLHVKIIYIGQILEFKGKTSVDCKQ